MQWVINDEYYAKRIVETVETVEILILKQCLQENGYKCKVCLTICDPSFWREQFVEYVGPVGIVGPRGYMNESDRIKQQESKQIADPRDIIVTIEFVLSDNNAEKICTHELAVTKNNNGEHFPTWNIIKIRESLPYMCGIYKRKGFDDAFHAVKIMKPHITEELFARDYEGNWDLDLVEQTLFKGMDECIVYENIETGKSYVKLSLLSIDILANIDYIKTILSPYKV